MAMNPMDAARLARDLMDAHGLLDWQFRFNNRKSSLGLCQYHAQRIELSRYLVRDNDEPAVRDTLLHEIAHALAGPDAGHGPRWKAMCRRIGARPERVDCQAAMPKGDWHATCPQCGAAYHRHRRPPGGVTHYCRTCRMDGPALVFQHRHTGETTAEVPFTGWLATCPGCGEQYRRQRRPARHLTYYCSACSKHTHPLTFHRHVGR